MAMHSGLPELSLVFPMTKKRDVSAEKDRNGHVQCGHVSVSEVHGTLCEAHTLLCVGTMCMA